MVNHDQSWDGLLRALNVIVKEHRVPVPRVAAAMNVHRSTVYRLMKGDIQAPSGPLRTMLLEFVEVYESCCPISTP